MQELISLRKSVRSSGETTRLEDVELGDWMSFSSCLVRLELCAPRAGTL